jgi:hypothetical protein
MPTEGSANLFAFADAGGSAICNYAAPVAIRFNVAMLGSRQ